MNILPRTIAAVTFWKMISKSNFRRHRLYELDCLILNVMEISELLNQTIIPRPQTKPLAQKI